VPRPILYLLIAVVVLVIALFGLASLDREVPTTRTELPVTNATAR
jgi:Tfp pilus assembly protein PilV